ncbi:MAG: CDP-glucose 4,6-dehydratase [Candidatus Eremiobacteraeota bacterium]|nr:CDP-glucose 4,6-dehydratase [Candidatus Eremiobacteraeota bacterium]
MTSTADSSFWRGRRVLVTGHTGFKGAWLCALLLRRGASVSGLALPPDTTPNLWAHAPYAREVEEILADVRDADAVRSAVRALRPQTVLHLAAQPLVRRGYAEPVETYAINVMGTVHVLDAVRACSAAENVVVVTSDKVYADRPVPGGYAEDARLGGADPYAGSKAAAELVVETYRSAFFSAPGAPRIASARAGNVIGGGDFAADRLVPDAYRAVVGGEPLRLRRPEAVRPWQHVLEPLHGYLLLAESLASTRATACAYNFGPAERAVSVRTVAQRFVRGMGAQAARAIVIERTAEHETAVLEVDSSSAHALGWAPRWSTADAVDASAAWYRAFAAGTPAGALVERDLAAYERAAVRTRFAKARDLVPTSLPA